MSEVPHVRLLLLLLVTFPRLGDLLGKLKEVRVLLDEHIVDLPRSVQRETEHIANHTCFRKSLLLRITPKFCQHISEQVLGVLPIHDGKARREARLHCMPAEYAISD